MLLLKLEGLNVCVDDRVVVRGVDLDVSCGEVHVILGPNGAGKTSLLSAIMGLPRVRVCGGAVIFEGEDITGVPAYERARRGIALAHQFVPAIRGVRVADIVRHVVERFGGDGYEDVLEILDVKHLMGRYLFYGFSGGERRRLELYLSLIQRPKLALLDEPDSGVDVDSLRLIAEAVNYAVRSWNTSIILVTHSGAILDKLYDITRVHIMLGGRIVHSGDIDVARVVLSKGYVEGLKVLEVALQ
ncbi:MAG: ATP-binding cassette domain-containing protein [Thermoprotei archaeon]|nr:ATP-binding cassette domain-containing protein [Thermoprotei archaeon]